MDPGPVLYTWSGDAAIAYQVAGEGEKDLFYLGTWGSTLDLSWSFPPHARFLTGLAAFSRLVLHDGRGHGSSDGPSDSRVVTFEERADDLLAVADAVNAYDPVLFGAQESSIVAMAVAATRPWAFSALVLYEPAPVWSRTDELPWETHREETRALIESVRRTSSYDEWTRSHVRSALPSLAADPRTVTWLAATYRAFAPPAATIAEIEYLDTLDLTDLLPKIALPTLVLHRPDAGGWSSESARYVAERIPDAREVALPGRDQFPWAGDADAVVAEIEEFVAGSRGAGARTASARAIATVLFSDIVASTATAATVGDAAWRDLIGKHHETVRNALVRHRGIEQDTAGDGFFATFDAPERALRCGIEIVQSVQELGLDVRIGIHTGEVEAIDGKPGGIAVSVGARIAALAEDGEILVSSTVKDLVTGSGLEFSDAGDHELRGVPGTWHLYRPVVAPI